jgi:hypothetical protein
MTDTNTPEAPFTYPYCGRTDNEFHLDGGNQLRSVHNG